MDELDVYDNSDDNLTFDGQVIDGERPDDATLSVLAAQLGPDFLALASDDSEYQQFLADLGGA